MKSITQVVQNLIKPYIDGKDNNIYEVMGRNGAKNLIPFPYYNDSPHTTNGITFTVNPDGSVTASGTASADAYFRCTYTSGDKHIALLADTDYILRGTGIASVAVLLRNSGGSNVVSARATDVTYSCTSAGNYDIILLVENGTDLTTPLTIYPMLRYASDTDDTYQPYAKTNQQLTAENGALMNKLDNEIATRSALGAKNRLPITLASLKQTATAGTWANNVYTENGINFTINTNASDYVTSIVVSGTASGVASINLLGTGAEYAANDFAGMILTGCPSGGGNDNYRTVVFIGDSQDGTGHTTQYEDGAGVTIGSNSYLRIYLRIASGTNLTTPITFYPMIRLASDPDDTYQPYAKTNQELSAENQTLTNEVTELSTKVSSMNVEKIGYENIFVTADGVKTWRELIGQLASNMITHAQNKGYDQYQIQNIWLQSFGNFFLCDSITLASGQAIDIGAYVLTIDSSGFSAKKINFRSVASSVYLFSWDGAISTDHSSEVPAQGNIVSAKYIGYKFFS